MKVFRLIPISLILFGFIMASGKQTAPLSAGDIAPTFALMTLDGNYVALRDFCGEKLRKPWKNKTKYAVVISFFATWCKPCMKEIPHLEKLKRKYGGKNIKFFLIDVGEKADKVNEFVRRKNISIPVLLDPYQKTAEKYDALSLPRLYVLDKNGIIRKEQKGFSDGKNFEEEMKNLLDKLSGETS